MINMAASIIRREDIFSVSKINAAELSTKALLNNIGSIAILSYDKEFSELYLNESSLITRTIAEKKILFKCNYYWLSHSKKMEATNNNG